MNISGGAAGRAACAVVWLCLVGCNGSSTAAADAGGDAAGQSADVAVDAAVCNGGAPQGPGGPCRCAADCEPGAVCGTEEETGQPGGSCLAACDPNATARPGLLCRSFQGENFYLRGCGPGVAEPCRAGWYCRVFTGSTRDRDRYQCEPQCAADTDCLTGRCDRYTGFCQAEKTGRANGEPCTTDAQCRGGVCFAFGEGMCTSLCDTRTGFCPDNGYCLPPVQADAGAHNGSCLTRCAQTSDCRRGFTCRRAQGQGVCSPNL